MRKYRQRTLDRQEGLRRAQGPIPYRPVELSEYGEFDPEDGVRKLEEAKVQDGFEVAIRYYRRRGEHKDDPQIGIVRLRYDLVSGQLAEAMLNGKPVNLSGIRSVKVLSGPTEASTATASVSKERRVRNHD